jgi:hypothetical protein
MNQPTVQSRNCRNFLYLAADAKRADPRTGRGSGSTDSLVLAQAVPRRSQLLAVSVEKIRIKVRATEVARTSQKPVLAGLLFSFFFLSATRPTAARLTTARLTAARLPAAGLAATRLATARLSALPAARTRAALLAAATLTGELSVSLVVPIVRCVVAIPIFRSFHRSSSSRLRIFSEETLRF